MHIKGGSNLSISEWLFLAGIFVLVLFCGGTVLCCGRMRIETEDWLKKLAVSKRNIWIRSSVIWMSLYYWLVLNSILTTLIVLYISCYEDMGDTGMRIRVFAYSAISLFSSICPYIVNMLDVSKAYRAAFRVVDNIILSDGDLREAIRKGEEIIDGAHK